VNNFKNKNSINAYICKLAQDNGAANIDGLMSYSTLKEMIALILFNYAVSSWI
jgi:hypothetical protein